MFLCNWLRPSDLTLSLLYSTTDVRIRVGWGVSGYPNGISIKRANENILSIKIYAKTFNQFRKKLLNAIQVFQIWRRKKTSHTVNFWNILGLHNKHGASCIDIQLRMSHNNNIYLYKYNCLYIQRTLYKYWLL